jgi:hypothetical protein
MTGASRTGRVKTDATMTAAGYPDSGAKVKNRPLAFLAEAAVYCRR